MTTFGFEAANTRPACDHRGQFAYRDIGSGMQIRFCEGCGQTHILAQLPDTSFALIRVPEYEEGKWGDVAPDVHEGVPAVRDGEGLGPVPGELGEGGRDGGLVPQLPAAGESGRDAADAPTREGDE